MHKILLVLTNVVRKKTYYRHIDNGYKLKPVSQTEAKTKAKDWDKVFIILASVMFHVLLWCNIVLGLDAYKKYIVR